MLVGVRTLNAVHNLCIRRALELANGLTVLADEGEAECLDDGCAVLYGVIRDCAYKIRGRAEEEREVHKLRGLWDEARASR
jgi:hypothetical protein